MCNINVIIYNIYKNHIYKKSRLNTSLTQKKTTFEYVKQRYDDWKCYLAVRLHRNRYKM